MGYTQKLLHRQKELGRPVRVGLVGAGQMGSGFIVQIARQKGVDIAAVADVVVARAVTALTNAGMTDIVQDDDIAELSLAIELGRHVVVDDALTLTKLPVDIVIECSGVPDIAAKVALASLLAGKDVALMTIEADVTVGLLLAKIASQTGNIYTVCRGDEPVECLKLVEYVEDIGLEIICAGKGKNNPLDHSATPATLTDEALAKGMNPRMLCSFVDGTKTMIEMAALANASGLELSQRSMNGAAATVPTLHDIFKPQSDGGILDRPGVIDYATGPVAPGVFVIAKVTDPVVLNELRYLKLGDGPYYAFYRPYHLASIEAVLSIGEVVIDRQSSLAPIAWKADVSAVAKRDLKSGEKIDGIGGDHVYGDAVPASIAAAGRELPIGLAFAGTLARDVAKGTPLTYDDVVLDESKTIVILRKLQDALLADGQLGAVPLELVTTEGNAL